MKKMAIWVITMMFVWVTVCAEAVAEGSIYADEFLVRFAYRAAKTYDLKITGDPQISKDTDEDTYFIDGVILQCKKDGAIRRGAVSISKEVTDEEIKAILCLINSFEYSWIEYSFYTEAEIWNLTEGIFRETMHGKEYIGKEYTYKLYAKEGLFVATISQ
jgi:hypothetical protein